MARKTPATLGFVLDKSRVDLHEQKINVRHLSALLSIGGQEEYREIKATMTGGHDAATISYLVPSRC